MAQRYSVMRRGIVEHAYHVDESNVDELREMDFVFLCIDAGGAKRAIVEHLEELRTPFVDVGMGVHLVDDRLLGILRVTASTDDNRDVFRREVSLSDAVQDDYDTNIQVADLNALNAALAVVKWKKLVGFYWDHRSEVHATYTIDSNMLLNNEN